MKKILTGVALTGVLMTIAFSSGCAYKSINHGTEITDEQVSQIIDGKTTRDEILIEFGDPSKTMNDEKAYFYSWTRGSKGHLLGIGSGSAYSQSLVVVFNDQGVVTNHKITRGTTEASANVGD
jgi:outer membrane protein assembly factor BamE (lipoprotein component of BamABCDE complex)